MITIVLISPTEINDTSINGISYSYIFGWTYNCCYCFLLFLNINAYLSDNFLYFHQL